MARTPRPCPADNSIDPDGEFPLGTSEYFFYLLFQAARQRDAFFDMALRPTGLDIANWRTLAAIRRVDCCAMSTLARLSAVERTTMTRSVDQLVARGLVERWVPARDRRQVNLALTAAGEAVYGAAVQILIERNAQVLGQVEEARLREATRVLQIALANMCEDARLAAELLSFGRPQHPHLPCRAG